MKRASTRHSPKGGARRGLLFVPDCFDGVHACCLAGRNISEEDADEGADGEAESNGPEGYAAGQHEDVGGQPAAAVAEGDA